MRERYVGDLAQANRIFSARKAAGFRTAEAFCLSTGLALVKFRTHEAGTRILRAEDARAYAPLLRVSFDWLWHGSGRGPAVDRARLERLKLRARQDKLATGSPVRQAGRRLRLARRLAGYRSVTAAAAKFGWARTTISSHEMGENTIGVDAAAAYGRTFGVNAGWIVDGSGRSGYPPEIERRLDEFLALHDLAEGEARKSLPDFKASPSPDFRPGPYTQSKAKPQLRAAGGDAVGEYDAVPAYAALKAKRAIAKRRPERSWTFPQNYLKQVIECPPATAIVLVLSRDDARRALHRGDRLIVDGADRQPIHGAEYAVIAHGRREVLIATGEDLRDAEPSGSTGLVAGRIRGCVRCW